MPLTLTPLSDLLGVEIAGVDCRVPPSAAVKAEILEALYTHQVIVFRDQTLATVAAQVGYADPFAFSVAFKRNRGSSPSDFRAAAAGGWAVQRSFRIFTETMFMEGVGI